MIARNDTLVDIEDPDARKAIFRDYGRFLTSLRGCYVAAEDAGTWFGRRGCARRLSC